MTVKPLSVKKSLESRFQDVLYKKTQYGILMLYGKNRIRTARVKKNERFF